MHQLLPRYINQTCYLTVFVEEWQEVRTVWYELGSLLGY